MHLFRTQAIEHRKQRLYGDVILLPRISHTLILGGLLVWVGFLLLWLFTSTYTEHETVHGWLEAPGGSVKLYPENSGLIKKLLVGEGEKVTKGQQLMVLRIEPKLNTNNQLNWQLFKEYEPYCQYLHAHLAPIKSFLGNSFIVKIQTEQSEFKLPSALIVKVSELCETFKGFAKQEAQDGGEYTQILKAPQSGIVSNLQVREGQQVLLENNMPLLTLMPNEAKIKAYILIPARLVGSLKQGQLLDFEYDAFSYPKARLSQGEIENISNTILLPIDRHNAPIAIEEPVYRVAARLLSPNVQVYGKNLFLKPGMTLSADIRLVDRKLIDWFLRPFISLKDRK
ncbi:HlyD family efflux transporter periplasmic adaptor subunit [Teredinibacter haidensis]|uniref:HlyD family efflux transporter periplasmic adaptor subunit n=1 Tax=Teredinibacter haidensis TaxID=2731755 RepID=UPI000AD4C0CB|nr:HlyD family efflux transporter periplasmic adaptor subunit [Teredinibacter haidensis]